MWTCPECGEGIEDQFDGCWKCAGHPIDDVEEDGSLPKEKPVDRPQRVCPDCDGLLQPIKMIDATEGPGWHEAGANHVELSFAAPDATRSFFLGVIPRLGIVKGMICPKCGRILFYGEKKDEISEM